MLRGTLYLFGKASAIRPVDDKEVSVEMLAIDTETGYEDFVKIDGEIQANGVPTWARDAYRHTLHYRTQVNKEVAREWLSK